MLDKIALIGFQAAKEKIQSIIALSRGSMETENKNTERWKYEQLG